MRDGRGAVRFALLALAVLSVGLVGYAGYELYPRFDLPAPEGVALLALALGAGLASFFSPCAFSLLLTLLARRAGGGEEGDRPSPSRALGFAGAFSLGALAFVLLLGAVIAFGGKALVGGVTFTSTAGRVLRLVVGAFLVLMGVVQAGLLPNPFHALEEAVQRYLRLQAQERRRRPFLGHLLFGFGYLAAGLG